jgi:hypothetical protein
LAGAVPSVALLLLDDRPTWRTLQRKRFENAPIDKQANDYIVDVMQHPALQADLLQRQFGHKLFHLAQAEPRIAHSGHVYHWGYTHNDSRLHLQIIPRPGSAIDFDFWISITSLAEDITNSVCRSGGFLDMLRGSPQLQNNFSKAYQEIIT